MGYDIHPLVLGRKLILGGVHIPFAKGLFAHSDGDVLIHALCDALLGAAGLGDIGIHFPNTDIRYKNISSLKLLDAVNVKISQIGYKVNNIDSVLIADKPNLSPYRAQIIGKVSSILKIKPETVNIKATTSEGVGQIGSKALASYAVALLERKR